MPTTIRAAPTNAGRHQRGNQVSWPATERTAADGTPPSGSVKWADALVAGLVSASELLLPYASHSLEKEEFHRLYADWLMQHGLSETPESLRTVARQAVYYHVLRRILGNVPSSVSAEAIMLHRLVADHSDPTLDGCIARIARQVEEARPGPEDLGRVYEALVPPEERRRLGHFQTPSAVVTLMVQWAIHNNAATVLDPGVGAGVFLESAFARLRTLSRPAAVAVKQLYGVDVNPIAVAMTALGLELMVRGEYPHGTCSASVEVADFVAGARRIGERDSFDAIVCNPPYSRHHELVNGYKEAAGQAAEIALGLPLSRLASLYVHFFARALSLLSPGGRLAFITPREYLEVGYARPLRQRLLENFRVIAVVLFPDNSLVFPGVLTSACISLIERGEPANNIVRFVEPGPTTTADQLLAAVEGQGDAHQSVRVTTIPQGNLQPDMKWTSVLSGHNVTPAGAIPRVELSRLLAVKRGIATGHNDFFCLTRDELAQWHLPTAFRQPVVTGADDVRSCVLTRRDFEALSHAGRPVWLFYWPLARPADKVPPTVRRYLNHGEQLGVPERYLCSKRTPWYVGERRTPPDVIFTLFNRDNPRFVLNEARAMILNNLHGLTATPELAGDIPRLKALLAWLNSAGGMLGLRQAGRVYGGMLKAEPGELGQMPVPDVRLIDDDTVARLAELFNALVRAQRRGRGVSVARAAIDAAFAQLG